MKQAIVIGSIGLWRKFLKESLEDDGMKVICFVDTIEAGKSYKGVPIITPEELPKYAKGFDGSVLVTFPVNNKRREVFLSKVLGYLERPVHIMNFRDVYKKYKEALVRAKKVGDFWLGENYDKQRALDVINLLSDEKSKSIVESWIKFRETLDVDYLVEPEEPQYFPNDLNLQRFIPDKYSLLDVGAFNGDTYLSIKERMQEYGKTLTLYAGVEPDQRNFSELVKTVESNRSEEEKDILLNVACFSKNTFLEFFETGTSLSSIVGSDKMGNGYHKIQILACALDKTFNGFKFDIVKIDVEGADLECLSGMKGLIASSQSTVMACLYHKPTHLYEIPEFFNSTLGNYHYFVRTHATFYIDTVLYVVPSS